MDSPIESNEFKVLMLPWLAHGHIHPFLELAKRLINHNFQICLCSTPISLTFITKFLNSKLSKSIKLIELNLPSLPNLPPHLHTTNGLPPHLITTLKLAYDMSSPTFAALIENLHPDLLIYDYNQWWAADAALSLGIPCVQFLTLAAASCSTTFHYYMKSLDQKYPFQEIFLKDYELVRLKQTLGTLSIEELKPQDPLLESMKRSSGIILIRSVREIEGKYIDYMSQLAEKKVVPIGSLIQESSQDENEDTEIIEWLNKKQDSSVVFVSFGSEYFLTNDEIEDIAIGLEQSNVDFIWVLRFFEGKKIRVEDVLPKGFLERIGDKGIVVENWAPQAKILSHSSTGGFVSHCGWGSVLESIHFGVPIIAMPMQVDQPFNARIVAEYGVGVDVGRGEDGRLKREEIAAVVRQVVVGEDGERVREKMKELSEMVRKKKDEDVGRVIVEDLIQLCKTKRSKN